MVLGNMIYTHNGTPNKEQWAVSSASTPNANRIECFKCKTVIRLYEMEHTIPHQRTTDDLNEMRNLLRTEIMKKEQQ